MRVRGASMAPARIHPPSRPNTSSNASMAAAFGTNASTRSERSGPTISAPSGTYRSRNTHTTASSMVLVIIRNAA